MDVPGDVRNPAADLCTTSPSWEEIMKRCLVVPFVGLAISFALPTYAQQKDVAEDGYLERYPGQFHIDE